MKIQYSNSGGIVGKLQKGSVDRSELAPEVAAAVDRVVSQSLRLDMPDEVRSRPLALPRVMATPPTTTARVNATGLTETSGTSTAATANLLTDSNATWIAGQFVGSLLRITSGTGAGQSKLITANTTTTISTQTFSPAPDAASSYEVVSNNQIFPADARLRLLAPRAQQAAGVAGNDVLAVINLRGSGTPAVTTVSAQVWDTIIFDNEFEIQLKDQGPSTFLRVMVDGEYVSRDNVPYTWLNNGSYTNIRFAFDTAAYRHLVIELSDVAFRGILLHNSGVALTPNDDPGPLVMFAGDSYTDGARIYEKTDGYGMTAGRALGWQRVAQSGRGGTGWLTDLPGSGFTRLRDRFVQDILPHAPDILIVCMGINDDGKTRAAIKTEVLAFVALAKASLPNLVIILTGPWCQTGATPLDEITVRDGVKDAALELGLPFIDTIGGPYPYSGSLADYVDKGVVTGTGTSFAPKGAGTGKGNADTWIGHLSPTDVTHPTRAGYIGIGLWLARELRKLMPIRIQ